MFQSPLANVIDVEFLVIDPPPSKEELVQSTLLALRKARQRNAVLFVKTKETP